MDGDQVVSKSDLHQIDYNEFGCLVQVLADNVSGWIARNTEIDVIVPILRSGGFTALHLAADLGITNILPAQYKYTYGKTIDTVKKFELPDPLFELPFEPTILVVDTNTVEGRIATKVIRDLRLRFANAKIVFASLVLDAALTELTGVDELLCARQSNESRSLSVSEAAERSISNELLVFPWENLEEEWEAIDRLQKRTT